MTKYFKIKNYECNNCGSNEYTVIDIDEELIICDKCGAIYEGKYEVEEIEDTEDN